MNREMMEKIFIMLIDRWLNRFKLLCVMNGMCNGI